MQLVDSNKILVDWSNEKTCLDDIDTMTVVKVSPEIGMREAIELKQRSKQPLLLVEEENFIGLLTDNELYDALLGKFKNRDVA